VLDILEDRPEELLITSNKRNRQVFDVYLLNTATNTMTMVAENPGNITGWITDHDGRVRAAVTSDGVNTSLLFRESEKDPFRTVFTTTFHDSFYPVIFTFDNKNLYCVSNIDRDKLALVEYDPTAGKEVRVLYEHPDYDISGV